MNPYRAKEEVMGMDILGSNWDFGCGVVFWAEYLALAKAFGWEPAGTSGRQFAAWLGLTPLQKSSGGKERLGRITKMGDKDLRKLLIVGMTSLVRRAKQNPGKIDPRLADLLA